MRPIWIIVAAIALAGSWNGVAVDGGTLGGGSSEAAPRAPPPCGTVPFVVEECGDTMTGDLRLVGAAGVRFTAGSVLQGNPSLTYGALPVCVAGGPPPCGDITGVVAGSGLSGGGTSGSVTLGVATGAITSTHIADGTITGSDIQPTTTLTAAAFAFSSPVTRSYAVNPSAWVVNTPAMTHVHTGFWVYGTTPGQTVIFTAPVNLPDGAVITSMKVALKDADPASDVEVSLFEHPLGSASAFGVAAVATSGAAGDVVLTDTSIGQNPVDNDSQSHFLQATYIVSNPPSLILVKDVIITYTVTTALP